MNRTNIEWTDYTWNPLTGCTRRCDYCYAHRMAKRLRGRYGYPEDDPFKVTFHPNRLSEPRKVKKPSKIFTCSMGEIFDPTSTYGWVGIIFAEMKRNPQHIFQVLTKCYYAIPQFEYPDNCWVGASIDKEINLEGIYYLTESFAPLKFISFEPLLERMEPDLDGIDWIIIGAKTGPDSYQPKEEWVATLTRCARDVGASVFHKDNLKYGWVKEFPSSLQDKK